MPRQSSAAFDDAALRAANSPRRRRILQLVWNAEMSSSEIAAHLDDVTWQAVSLNLKVLRDAGLVRERREGTRRLYSADRTRCAALESLLRAMWKSDLEQLGALLERDRRKGNPK